MAKKSWRGWPARRLFPLVATVGLIGFGMVSTIWWGPALLGQAGWSVPHDLWGTLVAASRLLHLDLGGLYTQPTGLVAFPGAAAILVPVVAIIDAAGLGLGVPGPQNAHPAAWLLAGPYEVAISCVVLFAADAIAERLGVTKPKRAVLAVAEAVALWGVSVQWGHPEDAVAVGLLLYAIAVLPDRRPALSAWLTGAAVAVQPLVLLALPVVAVVLPPRRLAGFLLRAAVPGAVLLGAAAVANWTATIRAVTSQPNWPTVDHRTPWTWLAPQLGGTAVAAGPARALTILLACGCALAAGRAGRIPRQIAPRDPFAFAALVWWVAAALALRCLFEPVMVAYYLWPALAASLIAASLRWASLLASSVAAAALTVISQAPWHGMAAWWVPMIGGLCLTLFLARVPRRSFTVTSGEGLHAARTGRDQAGAGQDRWPGARHARDVGHDAGR